MKRQRTAETKPLNKADNQGKVTTAMAKKGKKNASSAKVEEEKRSVDIEDGNEQSSLANTGVAEESLEFFEEYYPWLGGVVDEQMSWGSICLPVWGVEYVVESYSEMFSDVAWDDDIWNLKSIDKIPNNP